MHFKTTSAVLFFINNILSRYLPILKSILLFNIFYFCALMMVEEWEFGWDLNNPECGSKDTKMCFSIIESILGKLCSSKGRSLHITAFEKLRDKLKQQMIHTFWNIFLFEKHVVYIMKKLPFLSNPLLSLLFWRKLLSLFQQIFKICVKSLRNVRVNKATSIKQMTFVNHHWFSRH